jgi:hypothetical protein
MPDTSWPTITALVAWLDESNGTTPHETSMRLIKLAEEVGEVSNAYIGMQGQSRCKGVTHQAQDVAAEPCDVIVTAMVALHSFTNGPAGVFAAKVQKIAARVGVEPATEPVAAEASDPIPAMARQLADQVIAYGLSELTDMLPDGCIPETIDGHVQANSLNKADRDRLFDDVYELVGKAGADYRRTAEVAP